MKHNKRILIVVSILIVIAVLFASASSILEKRLDNPISRALAQHAAEHYLKVYCTGTDYTLSSITFDEKSEDYWAWIQSPSSPDSNFSLTFNASGVLKRNSYEQRVEQRYNTAIRLSNAYRDAVCQALENAPLSYDFFYGHLESCSKDRLDTISDPAHCIVTDDLILDGVYPLADLGAKAGWIQIRVKIDDAEQATAEFLAQILLVTREILDQAGLPFYSIECQLDYPSGGYTERITIENFLYSNICEDDLTEQLQAILNTQNR